MVVREGSNVTLVCKARGYPEPYVSTKNTFCIDFILQQHSDGIFAFHSGYVEARGRR